MVRPRHVDEPSESQALHVHAFEHRGQRVCMGEIRSTVEHPHSVGTFQAHCQHPQPVVAHVSKE